MTKRKSPKVGYRVFVSHDTRDTWVAEQILKHIEDRGAIGFLDSRDIAGGDDIKQRIREELEKSDELLILFTPWSIHRRWIHYEIGAADALDKRIVCIFYNVTIEDFRADEGGVGPVEGLKTTAINELDTYFNEMQGRVARREAG